MHFTQVFWQESGTCGPVIPVQRSNQTSYRIQWLSSNRRFVFDLDAVHSLRSYLNLLDIQYAQLSEAKPGIEITARVDGYVHGKVRIGWFDMTSQINEKIGLH